MKRNSRRFVRKQNQPTEKSRSPFFNLAHDESKQHTSFFQTQLKTGEKYPPQQVQIRGYDFCR